jgi:ribosomal protein L32
MATPKTRRSKTSKLKRLHGKRRTAVKTDLRKKANGRLVPRHLVTAENPEKKGIRFFPEAKKK